MGASLSLPPPNPWGRKELVDPLAEEDRQIRALVEDKEWSKIAKLLREAPASYASRRNEGGLLPLHQALAKQVSLEIISILLERFPEAIHMHDNDSHRWKPLHMAAAWASKDEAVFEKIFDKAPEVCMECDGEGRLPLHVAAASRASVHIVANLLKVHADGAGRRTRGGRLPLHFACEFRAPLESIKLILDAYPAGAQESSGLRSPLLYACEGRCPLNVLQVIASAAPEMMRAKGVDLMLPLHMAASRKATADIMQFLLLEHPEAVIERDGTQRLPLHHALEKVSPDDSVVTLIRACPETASTAGYVPQLPLHLALERNFSILVVSELLKALPGSASRRDAYGILPLRRAIKSRAEPDVVLALLHDYPEAAMDMDEFERLSLHYACARKLPLHAVQALLEAYPHAAGVPDKNGQLCLHLSAMRCAEADVVSLLLESYPEACMTRDNYNYLPLHHCIEMGASFEVMQLLVAVDVRCAQMEVDGKLPLHFALEMKRDPETITALLAAFPEAARTPERAEKGRLALHLAIERRHPESTLLLLEAAYPDECSFVRDATGRLPIHYCVEYDAPLTLVKKLLQCNPGSVIAKDLDFYFYAQDEGNPTTTQSSLRRPRKRRPGKTLLHYACEDMFAASSMVEEILLLAMPIDSVKGALVRGHGYGWTFLLSECEDRYTDTVERVLDRYAAHCPNPLAVQLLCDAQDELGRPGYDIATPVCRRILLNRLHFFGRYQFAPGPALHESENSIVRVAVDHGCLEGKRSVCVKFMRMRDQFDREVNVRSRVKLSEDFVVPVFYAHDSDSDAAYAAESKKKGLSAYPYCVVTAAGERDLLTAVQRERISDDYSRIRMYSSQLLHALAHLHSLSLIHGHIKPLNCVRLGGAFKLIDLGAAVSFGNWAGRAKVSTAYMPPEMVFVRNPAPYKSSGAGEEATATSVVVPVFDPSIESSYSLSSRTGLPLSDSTAATKIEEIPAGASIDMWALGALFYFLCTGETLLVCNVDDQLGTDQMILLSKWPTSVKAHKLSKVKDDLARNLISQLLSKDPRRRPSAGQALLHPFFSFSSSTAHGPPCYFRFQGMPPSFDVCICFRKITDRIRMRERMSAGINDTAAASGEEKGGAQNATEDQDGREEQEEAHRYASELEARLVAAGLRVCRCTGGGSSGWQNLQQSRAIAILLSRGAINQGACSFEDIAFDSPAADMEDDFFLDIRLSIELGQEEHGLVEAGVYAILIGDKRKEDSSFLPYFATSPEGDSPIGNWGGAHPLQLCDRAVDAVERRVCEILPTLHLGSIPILTEEKASVVAIVHSLTTAGRNIEVLGEEQQAWDAASADLVERLASRLQGRREKGRVNVEGEGAGLEYEREVPAGETSAENTVSTAEVLLLQEKIAALALDISVLNRQIQSDQQRLQDKKLHVQKLKYKYSIYDDAEPESKR